MVGDWLNIATVGPGGGGGFELDALGGVCLRRTAKRGAAVPVSRRLVYELQSRGGETVSTGSHW